MIFYYSVLKHDDIFQKEIVIWIKSNDYLIKSNLSVIKEIKLFV